MSWTPARIDMLKALWAEGLSATAIAARFGNVTRNAVIGKVHRLSLPQRLSAQRPRVALRRELCRPKMPVPVLPQPKSQVALLTVSAALLALDGLRASSCRWPYGDPKQEGFGFCGREHVRLLPRAPRHSDGSAP